MTFVQARNYTRTSGRRVDVIVLHSMENDEKPSAAINVARWFAGATAPKASAHYCLDAVEVVQGVRDQDVAWAAPGANHNGLQFEHAGRARQTRKDWFDPYSRAMLELSVKLAAAKCREHNIPVAWLTVADLKAGRRGITSHANVSLAFGRSSHWDPGPGFPQDWYVSRVRELMDPPAARFTPPWGVFAGGRQIAAGRLVNPVVIQRISKALRSAGKSPPYRATVNGAGVIATGRFWPPGKYTRAVSAQLRAGREVMVEGVVTIRPKEGS